MGEAAREVDLVLFEAGGRRWAADAFSVLRVDHVRPEVRTAYVAASSGYRALVVRDGADEVQVPIDALLGFERAPARDLRPLPHYARPPLTSAAVVGAWLGPVEMVLLIDLPALVKETR